MDIEDDLERQINTAKHEDVQDSYAPVNNYVPSVLRYFDEADPEWEFYLQRIAEAAPLSTRSLSSLLDTKPATGISPEESSPKQYGLPDRWGNLFVICKNHINSGKYDKALSTLDEYVEEFALVDPGFKSRPLYQHLRGEILKEVEDDDSLREAFDLAIKANSSLPEHPGIQNNLGEIIAKAQSKEITLSELHPYSTSEEQLVNIGIAELETAIDNHSEIPQYHATLGRLLAYDGDFDQAINEIKRAIRISDPDRERYNIRISQYHRFLSDIGLMQQDQKFQNMSEGLVEFEETLKNSRDEIQKLEDKYDEVLRDFQTRNLQFIGFFAAIIAVVIAVVDVAITVSFPESAGLILVLVGGVLLAFTGLGFILPTTNDESNGFIKGIVNVLLGIALILVGLNVSVLTTLF